MLGWRKQRDNHVNQPIRLLIADVQPRARRSLEALFTALRWSSSCVQPPIEIVGQAGDDQQMLEHVQALHPDVVIMDPDRQTNSLAEPKLDGLGAIRMIKRQWPAVRVVVLTMYATDRAAALAAGADAFLLKGCPTSELWAAVTTVSP
jgi:DNA-binding NarL/FixJ family response regulator